MPSHQRSQAPAAAPPPTANKPRTFTSERNIVFHVVELAGGLLRGWLALGGAFGLGGGLGLGARARGLARLAGAGARPQHLHDVAADLGRVAVLPLLVLPLARAQASLDVDLGALLQVLARDLRQAPEKGDAVPLGRLFHLAARLVLPAVGRRHADIRHRVAARRVAGLRVGAQRALHPRPPPQQGAARRAAAQNPPAGAESPPDPPAEQTAEEHPQRLGRVVHADRDAAAA